MDFTLTEEQILLQHMVQDFLHQEHQFKAKMELIRQGHYAPSPFWKRLGELGILAAAYKAEQNGLGQGAVGAMVIAQIFGKQLVREPYIPSAIFYGGLLARHSTKVQQKEYLTPLLAGKTIGSVAAFEAQSHFHLSHCETYAQETKGGFVLNGQKAMVEFAPWAEHFIISARIHNSNDNGEDKNSNDNGEDKNSNDNGEDKNSNDNETNKNDKDSKGSKDDKDDKGNDTSPNQQLHNLRDKNNISLFIVPAKTKGLQLTPLTTIEESQAAMLSLNNVMVPSANLLGQKGKAFSMLLEARNHVLGAICAQAIGQMQALLEATIAYTTQRKQFGRPLSQFQVLQHRMVDMFIELQLSTSMTYRLNMMLDSARPLQDKTQAAYEAKIQIGEAAHFVGQNAVQLHGAIGLSDALPISHLFKSLCLADIAFGSRGFYLDRLQELDEARDKDAQ